mmetsp:Transcript_25529/g.69290  ORF Transcript_25529/g.69290 Transcript_25529/m.69290 type:complete len:471 (-) Transcript_25529:415-1827(-)
MVDVGRLAACRLDALVGGRDAAWSPSLGVLLLLQLRTPGAAWTRLLGPRTLSLLLLSGCSSWPPAWVEAALVLLSRCPPPKAPPKLRNGLGDGTPACSCARASSPSDSIKLRRGERFALEVADACCEGGAAARGKADERAEYMGARLPHSPGDLDIQSSVGCALVLVRSGEGIAVAGRADGGGTAPGFRPELPAGCVFTAAVFTATAAGGSARGGTSPGCCAAAACHGGATELVVAGGGGTGAAGAAAACHGAVAVLVVAGGAGPGCCAAAACNGAVKVYVAVAVVGSVDTGAAGTATACHGAVTVLAAVVGGGGAAEAAGAAGAAVACHGAITSLVVVVGSGAAGAVDAGVDAGAACHGAVTLLAVVVGSGAAEVPGGAGAWGDQWRGRIREGLRGPGACPGAAQAPGGATGAPAAGCGAPGAGGNGGGDAGCVVAAAVAAAAAAAFAAHATTPGQPTLNECAGQVPHL